jgi:hypothetical protein
MAKEIMYFTYEVSHSYSLGSLIRHESTTWDRQLYFPFEGSRAASFFVALKYPTVIGWV